MFNRFFSFFVTHLKIIEDITLNTYSHVKKFPQKSSCYIIIIIFFYTIVFKFLLKY